MKVLTLGLNVFKRQRRTRAFWVMVAIFLFLTVANYVIAVLQKEVVVGHDYAAFIWDNSGLVPVLCMLLTVALAQSSVSYEIGKSTIHLILARPVSPEECMTGMYAGSLISILVPYLVLSMVSLAGMAAVTGSYLGQALAAIFLFMLPLALLTVIVTTFSAWMSGAIAGMLGFALFIFSFFSASMDSLAERVNIGYAVPLRVINFFSMRLDAYFDSVHSLFTGQAMAWRPLVWEAGYAIIIVALGISVFRYRKV